MYTVCVYFGGQYLFVFTSRFSDSHERTFHDGGGESTEYAKLVSLECQEISSCCHVGYYVTLCRLSDKRSQAAAA